MSQINVQHLTFAYEGSYDNIFEDASFCLDTDWRLGFVGRNGRGKTTFLNLLRGLYPYRGTISASVAFTYFPYEVEDGGEAAWEVARRTAPGAQEWELERELNLLGVPRQALERPFCTLSNGERTKTLLAALFLRDNAYLLIDEPTNHLDLEGRRAVGDYLRRKSGFLLVSHDRAFLDRSVDHILSINRAGIEVQQGNFSSWQRNRAMEDAREMAENERLQKDIRRLGEAARRAGDWSDRVEKTKTGTRVAGLRPDRGHIGHQAAKLMKRAKAIEKRRLAAAEEKEGLLKNIERADPLKIHPLDYHTDELVSLERVSVCYDGRAVCENVSFSVRRGERVALAGRNGSGKSSLLRLICGEMKPGAGTVRAGSGLRISHVAQDASALTGSLDDYARSSHIDETLFKTILRKLDFSRVQFEKDLRNYSEGQRKKVLIARSLCERAHLYIWDEPLNYIDILSRMQIETLLKEFCPTMIFVEHDEAFCESVATKTVRL